jgi:hypothetical protein
VRPGSRTKVSVPLVLPQNRHPERSASPIDRVIHRLWRGVEGSRRCLSYPCCSELFDHRPRHSFFLGPRTRNLLASCYVRRLHLHSRRPHRHALHWRHQQTVSPSQQILLSGLGGRKAPSSMGKISSAEVLRLRAASGVSRDQSVRRSAQDDDFMGVLTKNTLNKLALICP